MHLTVLKKAIIMSLTKPTRKPFLTDAFINKMLAAYEKEADASYAARESIAYLCHFIAEYDFGPGHQLLKLSLHRAIKAELGSFKLTLWSTESWYDYCGTNRDKSTIRASYLQFLLLDFATNGPFPATSN